MKLTMKLTHLFALIAAVLTFISCDDDTATLGVDMMPASDILTKSYKVYDVTTESYAVGDSVLARTTMSYFGRFTDPETGTTIKSDFLAQFHCDENFDLPTDMEMIPASSSTYVSTSKTLWETRSPLSNSAFMN